jgi:hypothetical protein
VQLGLENNKKTLWAAGLGLVAVLAVIYQFSSFFMGSSPEAASSAHAAAPDSTAKAPAKPGAKGKKVRVESLDPTLRLDLLASSEQTLYEGKGRNIFVSAPVEVEIPNPVAKVNTDPANDPAAYHTPAPPVAPPIPLKFFGFASKAGEPKKIFLQQGEDIFVAGEGEIVNRRYKVVRINASSVEMQDVVNSGPPQSIPLTQGQG